MIFLYPGLEKMFIFQEAGQFSHDLLGVFMYKNSKFPTKHEHFPGRSFPASASVPTMLIPNKRSFSHIWIQKHQYSEENLKIPKTL